MPASGQMGIWASCAWTPNFWRILFFLLSGLLYCKFGNVQPIIYAKLCKFCVVCLAHYKIFFPSPTLGGLSLNSLAFGKQRAFISYLFQINSHLPFILHCEKYYGVHLKSWWQRWMYLLLTKQRVYPPIVIIWESKLAVVLTLLLLVRLRSTHQRL